MPRYRAKVVVPEVEAMQYADDPKAASAFVGKELASAGQLNVVGAGPGVIIGNDACIKGNWIVKAGGKVWLMSDHQFRTLYEGVK